MMLHVCNLEENLLFPL